MITLPVYALILFSGFIFLLYSGVSNRPQDKFYGALGGFFILLMTGLIGFSNPVSIISSTNTSTTMIGNYTTSSVETYQYETIDNLFYYIFNCTLLLVGVGGLYYSWSNYNQWRWSEHFGEEGDD